MNTVSGPTPSREVFVTGASGFLGGPLLDHLLERGYSITALVRPGSQLRASDRVRTVVGDLLNPDSYQDALAGADAVLHLAASTGNLPATEHHLVNAEGTHRLTKHCTRMGVKRFVFMSSIAVTYPILQHYPYGQSKAAAETTVRSAGLDFTIVRPTIVLGPHSPILAKLMSLARLPIMPILGLRPVTVQPVYVDDVARFLLPLLDDDGYVGQTLELGGPSELRMDDFMGHIRNILRGTRHGRIRVPLSPVLASLALVERVSPRLAPVSVGQLSVFRYDSTAAANDLYLRQRKAMRTIVEMLQLSITQ